MHVLPAVDGVGPGAAPRPPETAPSRPEPGPSTRGRRRGGVAGLLVFVAAWAAVNIVWIAGERVGAPLNIDEAGYFGFALHDADAWQLRGPRGWVDQVLWPGVHAPLTSAVTSLGVLLFGEHPAIGFVVIVLAGAATLLATADLGARVRRPEVMWLSVVVVAISTDFVSYSRMFVFAIPVTLVTTAALCALVRSRHLTSLPWALAFGVLVGLVPLTRTMAIAFVPALAVAAVAYALVSDRRTVALVHTVAAGLVAAAVAASWLFPSRHLVLDYLTGYGYGRQSRSYTSSGSRLGTLLGVLVNTTYLPLFVLLAAGWVIAAWVVVGRLRVDGRATAVRAVRAPLFPCAVFVVGGAAAIASARSGGTGFAVPLLPPAAVVGTWGLWLGWRSIGQAGPRRLVAGLVAGVLVFAAVVVAAPGSWFGQRRALRLGTGVDLVLTGGASESAAYARSTSLQLVYDDDWEDAIPRVNRALLDHLRTGPDPAAAFAFRGYFVNVNTVQLEALEALDRPIPVAQIEPETVHDRRQYRHWLTRGAAAGSCFLLTAPGGVNEFTPLVHVRAIEDVATDLGFTRVATEPMPDGRRVHIWRRTRDGC